MDPEASSDGASVAAAALGPSEAPRRPIAQPHRPTASQVVRVDLPETLRYRLKNALLGPPLVNEKLGDERLGRPSALGVLAPDCISSSAYGSEEMLNQLIPFVGLAAFSLVVPITMAILGVLFFVTLSYLDVIKLYTQAGGAYVVARENFGPKIAQIAAVALLIDYTVTVAVQTAAGTDGLVSAFPRLTPYVVPITVGVILLLLYGNLRGIREAGKVFAFPTYFFISSLAFVVVAGYIKEAMGQLHPQTIAAHCVATATTSCPLVQTHAATGPSWLYGATFIIILRSFANGGSSLTGLEAISNGVATFREPASRHARQTLVVMSSVLAFLVLGVTLLAHWTHATPYSGGTPTVVSQEVRLVFGHGPFGNIAFYVVQAATVLILYTGGTTSFNGFPFLASYVAEDKYLPKQLTRRGHRLAFSNGIIVLTVVALILILVTGADLSALVALYAIGVFTGFTMAGLGMVKHWLDAKSSGKWRRHVFINGLSAGLSAIVVLIFATVKFKEGAWVVVLVGPAMFYGLIRLHRQYMEEDVQLEEGAAEAAEAPVLTRHVVVVLVDRLDMATARALQYARTLHPDELRAIHFALDPIASEQLEDEWRRIGLSDFPLDIQECEDRRLTRAALELAAETVADRKTELTILLPRRIYTSAWQRVLHDNTAETIATAVGHLEHVNATVVPYQLSGGWWSNRRQWRRGTDETKPTAHGQRAADKAADRERVARALSHREAFGERARGTVPIGDVQWRQRVRVAGRVRSVRVQPRAGTSNLECLLADDSGMLLLVFQGRRRIPGIQPGAKLVVEGMVGDWARRQAILNPDYELIAGPEATLEPS
jgi:amino acid transporter